MSSKTLRKKSARASKVRSEVDLSPGLKRRSTVRKPSERKSMRSQSTKQLQRSPSKTKKGMEYDQPRPGLNKQKSSKKVVRTPSMLKRLTSVLDAGFFLLNAEAEAVAENLQITENELRQLKRSFNTYNIEEDGRLTYDEFFAMIKDTQSPYTDALFSMIDKNKDGSIDFCEFVQVLGTYCSFTRNDIYRFVFDVFDADGSGAIDEQEFVDMCTKLNASKPVFPGNFKKVMRTFDIDGDGLIDFREFCQLNKRFPLIIAPALLLQDRMQKATLGERKWNDILKNKARQRYIEDYQSRHDGLLPPEDFSLRLYHCCFPRRSTSHYGVKRSSSAKNIPKPEA